MIEREYEYRLKVGRAQARAVLFGAGALLFAYVALTNDRGLILCVIPLAKTGATICYGVFAGLSALVCAYEAVNVAGRASLRQRIAFTEEGLVVPRSSWSAEERLIPYGSILDMKEFTEPDSLVVIRHREGEFPLRLDLLPDERAYAEIVHSLALRIQAAEAGLGGGPPKTTPPWPA